MLSDEDLGFFEQKKRQYMKLFLIKINPCSLGNLFAPRAKTVTALNGKRLQ